jgi:hypothetical protein
MVLTSPSWGCSNCVPNIISTALTLSHSTRNLPQVLHTHRRQYHTLRREDGETHRHIPQLPRLDQMPQRQAESQQYARPSNCDVRNTKERVPTSDEGDG